MSFFRVRQSGQRRGKGRLSDLSRMLKHFEKKKKFISSSLFGYYINQIDSMLPCVCSVIDNRRRQNVVRTSVTHSATPRVPLFVLISE